MTLRSGCGVNGFGELVGVSHGDATRLGGSGSYVNMDAMGNPPLDNVRRAELGENSIRYYVLRKELGFNLNLMSAATVLFPFLHSIKTEYWYGRGVSGREEIIVEPS